MDTLSSAKFRKSYARLTEPTIVTVNGHSLGMWVPAHAGPAVQDTAVEIERRDRTGIEINPREHYAFGHEHAEPSDPYRAFTPAPKPSQRKR